MEIQLWPLSFPKCVNKLLCHDADSYIQKQWQPRSGLPPQPAHGDLLHYLEQTKLGHAWRRRQIRLDWSTVCCLLQNLRPRCLLERCWSNYSMCAIMQVVSSAQVPKFGCWPPQTKLCKLVKKYNMTYDYCTDNQRYPVAPPVCVPNMVTTVGPIYTRMGPVCFP